MQHNSWWISQDYLHTAILEDNNSSNSSNAKSCAKLRCLFGLASALKQRISVLQLTRCSKSCSVRLYLLNTLVYWRQITQFTTTTKISSSKIQRKAVYPHNRQCNQKGSAWHHHMSSTHQQPQLNEGKKSTLLKKGRRGDTIQLAGFK